MKTVKESDFFHEGMSSKGFEEAVGKYAKACEDAGEQIPIWVRMQMDEEEITPPDPELTKALEEVDKEFGVKE